MNSATDEAKHLCKKLGEAEKLAALFGGSRKRKFVPKSECVVASQQAKKKKSNQQMKPKTVTVVLLHHKPDVVPKGHLRKKIEESWPYR